MENYKKVRSETEEETWDSFGIHWLKGDNEHIPIFYITEEIEQIQLLNELTDHFYERGFVALSGYGSLIPRVISTVESLKNQSILEGCQVNHISVKRCVDYWDSFFKDDKLESLCVVREVPRISIVLSKTPLNGCNIKTSQYIKSRVLHQKHSEGGKDKQQPAQRNNQTRDRKKQNSKSKKSTTRKKKESSSNSLPENPK
ncbi:uncharacterized protein [Lepeophtheirus salmonis]|uniref:uncharacterized protein n=1 Tax=Lepeophtheirus salmonis TaxID=72036 RepID=UPI001AE3BA28|nr:uncharacterized protein LOC121132066 [Lepeophtheirus salmonis]